MKQAMKQTKGGGLLNIIRRIPVIPNNNPSRIQFTNGNVTRYIYGAKGEKLRVTHQTAVPNITVAIGCTRELAPYEIQYMDSTDYLLGGSLTLKNGSIDKYYFDEGYCQASHYSATRDNFTFCYYDRDHLGSIRQVRRFILNNTNGTLLQSMNYYPFGLQFCDGSASNGDVQPHKYNGKEFDGMHGLNTYDYGARQYNPILGRWDRMDPLAEKKPWQSPYVYGRNNPIRFTDPDGKDEWDKVVGFAYGVTSDVIPGTGSLRDIYTPNNYADYNTGLKIADVTSAIIGTALLVDGGEKVAAGLGVTSASAAVTVGSGGFSTPITAVTAAGGADVALQGVAEAGLGAVMLANASNNSSKGYNRGRRTGASKNERHGDGGRGQTKADKQLLDLQNKLSNALSKKEKMEIKRKMVNIKKDAERKRHGEEHSRANKR